MAMSPELLKKCLEVPVANIGHLTFFGFMDVGIRPVYKTARFAGTACTAAFPGFDGTAMRDLMEAITPGDVVVIDRLGDNRYACFGDGAAFRIRSKGAVGCVIDGAATDALEIENLGFPTFSRSISPITTTRRGTPGRINVDVSCGGVVVHPGDIVIGDHSGVCVLDPAEAEGLVDEALEIEKRVRAMIAAGEVPPMPSHN